VKNILLQESNGILFECMGMISVEVNQASKEGVLVSKLHVCMLLAGWVYIADDVNWKKNSLLIIGLVEYDMQGFIEMFMWGFIEMIIWILICKIMA
jgi:hypothetical protein